MRAFVLIAVLGCAPMAAGPSSPRARPAPPTSSVPAARPPDPPQPPIDSAVAQGRTPWWAGLPPGDYALGRQAERKSAWALAVGSSSGHHHPSEGLLAAKVAARAALQGDDPGDATMLDLFFASDRTVLALYGRPLEADPAALPTAGLPPSLAAPGSHRVGPHLFFEDRHLFLECEVEGPTTNPEWGTGLMTARLEDR